MIELRLIQHALALARFGNFGRAADSLGISQPSLTRSIASLEASLGVKLFDRHRRGIEPTAFGAVFLADGKVLLANEAALYSRIEALAGLQEGALVIGAGPYASEISVGQAVARVSAAHPRLRVEIASLDPEDIVRLVKEGRCEVGIVDIAGLEHEPDLAVEALPPHPVHLACRPGHPLAGRGAFQLEEVLQFPLVTTTLRGIVAAVAGQNSAVGHLDRQTGNFAPAILVNSLSLARQIARDCDALFPGTRAMLDADVAAGHLVCLDFRIPMMQTNYGIVRRRDRTPSPALDLFVSVLRDVEAGIAGS
ncbi:MAG: LysR family transcriptional regulator [Gammaproteobacteria bacterium]